MGSVGPSQSLPGVRELYWTACLSLDYPLTRFLLQAFMFQKLAIWLLSRGDQLIGLQDVTEVAITKCVESMWRLTYYVAVQMFIMLIMYEEPWFGNRKAFFEGWPDQTIKFTVKIFYVCECGFYIFSIAALILWKVRRKYFSIMMLNHIITLVLIVYSYATRFFRIGSIVLALHDTSDVFLEIANLFKYGGKELAANMSFGLFALSWLFLRLIYYPFCIIWSTSYELIEYIDLQIPYHTWIYYIFNTLLLTLLLFHLYWWIFICSMVLKPLECKGKVDENAASDSERSR